MNKPKDLKFYHCESCGEILQQVCRAGKESSCGRDSLKELIPNTSDGAQEKHVPAVACSGDTVKIDVGSVHHPMLEEHSIEWVCLETDCGLHYRYLTPGETPSITFKLTEEKPVAAYAYCNLHGFWKAEI